MIWVSVILASGVPGVLIVGYLNRRGNSGQAAKGIGWQFMRIARLGIHFLFLVVGAGTVLAGDNRFLEIQDDDSSATYDLNTVQMLLPGKFSIMGTTVDTPDVMRFELKVQDTLLAYCARADGEYDVPAEVFLLGQPDMAVQKIKIETSTSSGSSLTLATWRLPYLRFATVGQTGFAEQQKVVACKGGRAAEINKMFRDMILNGSQVKQIFDCDHGLWGLGETSSERILVISPVKSNTVMERHYMSVCNKVTGHAPYMPP
jgi:hypothetical protein